MAEGLEIDIPTIKGAWETNLNVRPEKDWEKLEGRAVVNSNKKSTNIINQPLVKNL